MRMCAAIVRHGHAPRLVAKRSNDVTANDDHAFYGVSTRFAIDKLPCPRWRFGGSTLFGASVARTVLARRTRTDLVYGRDLVGVAIASELGLPVVLELHGVPVPRNRVVVRRIMRKPGFRGLVVISEALRRDLDAEGLLPDRVVVAHDAADLPTTALARLSSTGRPRVGYVGGLYPGRGIEVVIALAERMAHCDVEIVGGSEQDVARWRARTSTPNLTFTGFVPPAQLAERYRTFDVLLMPYARTAIYGAAGMRDSSRWASPMKMFEYMATGVPIVSSDLPVLAEVLEHEHNALVAPADDVPAWVASVQRLLDDRALSDRLAARAASDLANHYTWDARVQRIFRELTLDA